MFRIVTDLHSNVVIIRQTRRARVGSDIVHQAHPLTCSVILADGPPVGVAVRGEELTSKRRV